MKITIFRNFLLIRCGSWLASFFSPSSAVCANPPWKIATIQWEFGSTGLRRSTQQRSHPNPHNPSSKMSRFLNFYFSKMFSHWDHHARPRRQDVRKAHPRIPFGTQFFWEKTGSSHVRPNIRARMKWNLPDSEIGFDIHNINPKLKCACTPV